MLTLIHGDNLESSRNKLLELKHGYKEVRELSGKKFDPTELAQALSSSSLFGNDVVVVIEGFLTNTKKQLVLLEQSSVDVILYEQKEIDKATIAKLGLNANVFLFKLPVALFQFLDSLTLPLLQQALKTEPAEVIFTLLVRRIRELIQIKDGITPERLQGWQVARLTNQAKRFTMDELIAMHGRLLEIDIAFKTGMTPFNLTQLLEQFVISL